MLGNAKELEKNMVYTANAWDSSLHRIKSVKRGKSGIVVTHIDGTRVELDNMHVVRFFEPGKEPR